MRPAGRQFDMPGLIQRNYAGTIVHEEKVKLALYIWSPLLIKYSQTQL